MSRALLVLALIAGVAQAAPKKPHKSAKAKHATTSSNRLSARTPTKASLTRTDNMPRGYAWPPTKQMRATEKGCEARLDELGVAHNPAKSEGRIVDAITVGDASGAVVLGGIEYIGVFGQHDPKLDCELALGLEEFGKDLYDLGVRQIKYGSIFRFTLVRVGGKTKNILSRHALGIAMDIVSFVDDTGREANVKRDYKQDDPLLLGIESAVNTSGKFRLLLTPKNDPISHSDHFHLEVAVDYTATP